METINSSLQGQRADDMDFPCSPPFRALHTEDEYAPRHRREPKESEQGEPLSARKITAIIRPLLLDLQREMTAEFRRELKREIAGIREELKLLFTDRFAEMQDLYWSQNRTAPPQKNSQPIIRGLDVKSRA
jgi:hypothetical protein